MTTKLLSLQEMLKNLRIHVLNVRMEAANCMRQAEVWRSATPAVEPRDTKKADHYTKLSAEHAKTADITETMAAILEVQDYRGFRHAKKAQGVFTIRLMLANGKGGTLAEFRDRNPIVAWLSAHEAIKGQESAAL